MTQDFKKFFSKLIRSQHGSSLVGIFMAISILGVMALGALSIHSGVLQDTGRSQASESAEALVQSAGLFIQDPELCLDGVDGPLPGGPLPGLTFASPGSQFLLPQATSATGQDIQLGTNIPTAGNPTTLAAGVSLNQLDLRIDRLYLKTNGVQLVGRPLDTYLSTIYVSATKISTGTSLAERRIGDVVIQVDPALKTLKGCTAELGAQQICENMGCTYVPSSPDQKCQCHLPDMSCPAGQYISGYDTTTLLPTCQGIDITCNPAVPTPGRGPGYFMAGVSKTGTPICVALVPTAPVINGSCGTANGAPYPVAPTLPAEFCSAGTPTAVAGVGPWTWGCNGSGGGSNMACATIAPVVNGICGPANNTTPGAAPSMPSDLCTAGAPTAVAGIGPWNWSCNGSGGGTNASCATTATPPACSWLRISDNSAPNTSNIARTEKIPRALSILDWMMEKIPTAGACSSTCNNYPWLSLVTPPESPADGLMLSETFGGPIPPPPPIGATLTDPATCNAMTNGNVLAGLHNNYCSCMVSVTSQWRCNCP